MGLSYFTSTFGLSTFMDYSSIFAFGLVALVSWGWDGNYRG